MRLREIINLARGFRFLRVFVAVIRREGSTLLAQPSDCAADDLSHFDVTTEPVREVSMAAKI